MANYPIPPWLNVSPSDFGAAAARGAEISLGKARIAEEARQANMRSAMAASELAARREQEQQQSKRQEQELAYQKAYQDSQLGLRQQQLDREEAQFQMEVKTAAEKSQAQQEAQARIRAGEDPTKVWMDLGPSLGMTGNAMATLARKPPNLGEVTPIDIGGKKAFGVRTGANNMRLVIPPPEAQTNVQSVPVIGPHGEEIPGMIGVPGPGGTRIHNIPKETGAESLQKTIEARKAALSKTTTGTSGPSKSIEQQKVDRAHELAKQHPDWSKEEVIAEVKKEFAKR